MSSPLRAATGTSRCVICAHVKSDSFSGNIVMGSPACRAIVPSKIIYDFGIATLGGKKRDFPSRVLSVKGAFGSGKAMLVVGKFSQIYTPTSFATSTSALTKFLSRLSRKMPCGASVDCVNPVGRFHQRVP